MVQSTIAPPVQASEGFLETLKRSTGRRMILWSLDKPDIDGAGLQGRFVYSRRRASATQDLSTRRDRHRCNSRAGIHEALALDATERPGHYYRERS